MKFNPAPGWPVPPEGWLPPEGWVPDPYWPPAPAGWRILVDDHEPVRTAGTATPPDGTPPEPSPVGGPDPILGPPPVPVPAADPPVPSRPGAPSRRSRGGTVVAVIVVVLALGGVVTAIAISNARDTPTALAPATRTPGPSPTTAVPSPAPTTAAPTAPPTAEPREAEAGQLHSGDGPLTVAIGDPTNGARYIRFTGSSDPGGSFTLHGDQVDSDPFPVGTTTPMDVLVDRPWTDNAAYDHVEVDIDGPWSFEVWDVQDAPVVTGTEVSGTGWTFFHWKGGTGSGRLTADGNGQNLLSTYRFGDDPGLVTMAGNDPTTGETGPLDMDLTWRYGDVYVLMRASGNWSLTVEP